MRINKWLLCVLTGCLFFGAYKKAYASEFDYCLSALTEYRSSQQLSCNVIFERFNQAALQNTSFYSSAEGCVAGAITRGVVQAARNFGVGIPVWIIAGGFSIVDNSIKDARYTRAQVFQGRNNLELLNQTKNRFLMRVKQNIRRENNSISIDDDYLIELISQALNEGIESGKLCKNNRPLGPAKIRDYLVQTTKNFIK